MKATQKTETKRQAEAHRRTLQVLEDEKAMEAIYEALEEVKKGERGTPFKDLKHKYKRA